jgi:DNA-directed RNA polymerase sigma subunit (sigma70/sigma32)
MPRVREVPIDSRIVDSVGHGSNRPSSDRGTDQDRHREPSRLTAERYTPDTATQALMEAPPFEAVPLSKDELRPLLHAAQDALSVLDERESWIVHARIWRRMSVRQVAKELGLSKTHLDRVYKTALGKLRDELQENGAADDWFDLLGR